MTEMAQVQGLDILVRLINEALEHIYDEKRGYVLITVPLESEKEQVEMHLLGNVIKSQIITCLRDSIDVLENELNETQN